MHFKMNLKIYQTSFVMKEVVIGISECACKSIIMVFITNLEERVFCSRDFFFFVFSTLFSGDFAVIIHREYKIKFEEVNVKL